MRGADAMELIVERIAADIRLAFPDPVVRFLDDGELEVRTTEWWGAVGTTLDEDDDMTPVEVEDALAAVTEDVVQQSLARRFDGPLAALSGALRSSA